MLDALRLEDPDRRYAEVRLCSDLSLENRDFVREDGAWVLSLPRDARLVRLEYELELVGHDGTSLVVCDPDTPERAPGAFGEKSVLLSPTYRPPDWLGGAAVPAEFQEVDVRVLGNALSIRVWSPGDGALPLLLAHDGPEYDELAALTRYAGAIVARGAVAPFRVALLPPGDRDEWYSASALYGRALCRRILPALRDQLEVAGRPVGLGASLGALAMLHAQRTWPDTFGGLALQSGSFFMPRFDRHESGFPRYARIVRFVRSVLHADRYGDAVPTVMTCGAEEENIHNNRRMIAALVGQGYEATLAEVPDLHNYTCWRDALDPHLTRLLARLWPPG
ncbi:MAG TPA: alpha/beta hydrolase-fold protein [Solirubrobacteraceae bacterium]|nr:alpha/beta hydrolase-fold protein [Solirubrobacteraceae bacterium]